MLLTIELPLLKINFEEGILKNFTLTGKYRLGYPRSPYGLKPDGFVSQIDACVQIAMVMTAAAWAFPFTQS
jgi:hypothetical protein